MARQGVTQEQVFTAADELREEGIAPTVQSVRERIGSGSYTTINAHLSAWRKEHAGAAVADIPAIPDKVQAAFAQIWATAARGAQEGLEMQREALEAAQREMDRERASMAEEIERLENALDEQTGLVETVTAQRDKEATGRGEAEKQITALSIENARLGEQVKTVQAQAGAANDARDTAVTERERDQAAHEQERQQWAERLEQETALQERLQTELEAERKARGEAEKESAALKTESARLEERAGAAERRAGEMKDQLEDLQAKFADLARAQQPKPTRKKAPAPKSGVSSGK